MNEPISEPLIEVKDLRVEFDVRAGIVKAVDGLTMTIHRGKTLGVIGESGCGKSMTARAILNMIPKPGKITHGKIVYHRRLQNNGNSQMDDTVELTELDANGKTIREIRGGEIGMIFQEPMSSLTPVYTAGSHINEAVSSAPPDTCSQDWRSDCGAGDGTSPGNQRRIARDRHQNAAPGGDPQANRTRR